MTQITVSKQEKEVQREIAMRKKVYPGLVAKGKMTETEAAQRIAVMEAVLQTLQEKSEPSFLKR